MRASMTTEFCAMQVEAHPPGCDREPRRKRGSRISIECTQATEFVFPKFAKYVGVSLHDGVAVCAERPSDSENQPGVSRDQSFPRRFSIRKLGGLEEPA
jgi:hypothetical protein